MPELTEIKCATRQDLPNIKQLMDFSIKILQKPFLDERQIQASFEVMGLDTQLIDDGTYFCVWTRNENVKTLVGCGGWSLRQTLYGGNHSKGRSAKKLNPRNDAARIRAMYTHPDWARRGIGRLILNTCEQAARDAGFKRAQMMATMAGVPLYKACGYAEVKFHTDIASDGTEIPLLIMSKPLI